MSKYSHFEMCEKIFGQKYKWNEQKHDYEPYSRTDMWNKMIEQQDKISDLEAKLAESEKKAYSRGHSQRDIANEIKLNALREDVANKEKRIVELKQQLAESETKRKSLEEKVKFITEEQKENFVDGQKYNELKHQLEKSEKSKESYRLQNEQHHLQLLQFYSRLGVEAFGADIHEKALETLMIMKEQLAEKEKVSPKSSIKEIVKSQDIKCFFRDKTLAQIQKCGDVYSPEYGYFNFEDDYDELLNNKKDDRFDIVAIEVIKTTKSGN